MLEILLGHPSSLEHYFWKIHQSIDINLITINKAIKATAMICKLNLRIRLSYACVQLISRPLAG
jgi:hypothetical protein